jgi:hypothetical protein
MPPWIRYRLAKTALAAVVAVAAACKGSHVGPPLDPDAGDDAARADARGDRADADAPGVGGTGGGPQGTGGVGSGGATPGTGGRAGSGGTGTGGRAATGGRAGSGGAGTGGAGSGGTGTGGRAGSGGAGTGGCPPRFPSPQMFRSSSTMATNLQGTYERFYWAEYEGSTVYLRYAEGSNAAMNGRYNFVLTSNVDPYDVRVGENIIAALRLGVSPALVAYNPADGSEQGRMSAAGLAGTITVDDAAVYYIQRSSGPTPAKLMRWLPPSGKTEILSFDRVNIPGDSVVFVRDLRDGHIVLATQRDVWLFDLVNPTTTPPLILHTTANIRDIQGNAYGVLVIVEDGTLLSGRDLYVPIYPNPAQAIDMPVAIAALAATSGCNTALQRYRAPGGLFLTLYVYEGEGGLYELAFQDGAVSGLPMRLTTLSLTTPVVTRSGVVFAETTDGSTLRYYRVGALQ